MSGETRIRFTEEMKGHIAFGIDDPEEGRNVGAEDRTSFMFHLTIETSDIDRFYHEPEHEATARGWIECDQLGGRLPVSQGVFNLFVAGDTPRQREMRYRLFFTDGVGNPLTFVGVKKVEDHKGFDVWTDTSTLYSQVLQGHVTAENQEMAAVVAAGVLRILKRDFVKQITTFRASGPSLRAKARGFLMFLGLFGGRLFEVYIAAPTEEEGR
ncbi:MAG: hypothetical protein IH850_00260 [Acidobacteria bacterium]|nr:hypothetical protein [Acidobacteriota bacterium]